MNFACCSSPRLTSTLFHSLIYCHLRQGPALFARLPRPDGSTPKGGAFFLRISLVRRSLQHLAILSSRHRLHGNVSKVAFDLCSRRPHRTSRSRERQWRDRLVVVLYYVLPSRRRFDGLDVTNRSSSSMSDLGISSDGIRQLHSRSYD